jgi:hypothetical protein
MAGQFTIYRSTDGSAPTLSGTAGDLTTLLDACLVNGYGAKAAAGWSISYTATNRRAYKNGTGSTGLLWRIRDDAGGTGGAKEALIRGFESMSDVNTGSNPFPTSGLSALTDNSFIIRKSATADATTRPWIVCADAKTCLVFIQTGDIANTYLHAVFGDHYSLVAGDAWNALTQARYTENSAAALTVDQFGVAPFSTGSFSQGLCLARPYTGVAGAVSAMQASTWSQTTIGAGVTFPAYPNPADNSIYLSRVFFGVGSSTPLHVRGYFRGLWSWLHNGGVNDGDTFNGAGDLAGKTFLIIKNSPNQGLFVIETSNTLP